MSMQLTLRSGPPASSEYVMLLAVSLYFYTFFLKCPTLPVPFFLLTDDLDVYFTYKSEAQRKVHEPLSSHVPKYNIYIHLIPIYSAFTWITLSSL